MSIKFFSIFVVCAVWLSCNAPGNAAPLPVAVPTEAGAFLLAQAGDNDGPNDAVGDAIGDGAEDQAGDHRPMEQGPAPDDLAGDTRGARRSSFLLRGIFGGKWMEADEWSPEVGASDSNSNLEDHWAIGLDLEIRSIESPLGIVLAYHFSEGSEERDTGAFNTDFDLETEELQIGLRYTFDLKVHPDSFLPPNSFHIYLQGGISLIWVDAETDSPLGRNSQSDNGDGYWYGGGFYIDIFEHFNIGVDIKYSHAGVDLFGGGQSAGGLFVGLAAGVSF